MPLSPFLAYTATAAKIPPKWTWRKIDSIIETIFLLMRCAQIEFEKDPPAMVASEKNVYGQLANSENTGTTVGVSQRTLFSEHLPTNFFRRLLFPNLSSLVRFLISTEGHPSTRDAHGPFLFSFLLSKSRFISHLFFLQIISQFSCSPFFVWEIEICLIFFPHRLRFSYFSFPGSFLWEIDGGGQYSKFPTWLLNDESEKGEEETRGKGISLPSGNVAMLDIRPGKKRVFFPSEVGKVGWVRWHLIFSLPVLLVIDWLIDPLFPQLSSSWIHGSRCDI